MNDQKSLKSSFDQVAEEYDVIRPGYPDGLIEDVVRLSGIPAGGDLLEIGCGTGQATLPFARRGYSILCLDIGPDLLAIAANKHQGYPHIHFKNVSFEEWPLEPGRFDLVYSATAFHWIPIEVGYPKAALALKPGGALAIFLNEHPRPYHGFFAEVQSVYDRHVPEWRLRDDRPATDIKVRAQADAIRAIGLFASVESYNYSWMHTYTTSEYLSLLNTYSDHRNLGEIRRLKLFQAIGDLIEQRYGGKVEKPYLSVLHLAREGLLA